MYYINIQKLNFINIFSLYNPFKFQTSLPTCLYYFCKINKSIN